jgi:hypothetical protein
MISSEHEEREHGQPAEEEPEGRHRELCGAASEQREQHSDEAACKEGCAQVVRVTLATLEGLC